MSNINIIHHIIPKKQENLKLILENLPVAIYICDCSGIINYYNKAAAELWDREPEIGKESMKEGHIAKEITILRADGVRHVIPHSDPIFDSSGAIIGMVTMLEDITLFKQMENRLLESEVKYWQLAEELQTGISKKLTSSSQDDRLHHLAFDNSLQASIITLAGGKGRILQANKAARKLLGYSKSELLSKNRGNIFNIKEISFRKMLKDRLTNGHSRATVTVSKKSGKSITCEITSAFFIGNHGIEKAITTITDMSKSILLQKKADTAQAKIVAGNIVQAKSKQKNIDTAKNLIVDRNILLAKKESAALVTANNEWVKYISETSYDVMWDWNITNGEIYVGNSLEEVFGYKVKNNIANFELFTSCLLPEEKEAIEMKLSEALASTRKSWNDSFKLIRHDGSIASTISRANIVRDEKGKAVRLIGAIQDVSRVQELETILEKQVALKQEYGEIFKLAAKLSYDGIWDWNMQTNEFFLGEGFEELFGYALESNTVSLASWYKHIHPEDTHAVENGIKKAISSSTSHWEQAYRFIRADGTVANVYGRGTIIRDAEGKAYRMIGVVHDLSRLEELEEKLNLEIASKGKLLTRYEESFQFLFNSSSEVFFDIDLISHNVAVSDAYEKEFGYVIPGQKTINDWINHIHPDDKEGVLQDFSRVLSTDEIQWSYTYRFLRADDSIANVISSVIFIRNAGGIAYRMLGYMHDLSKQETLDEKTQLEILLKEKQIAEATQEAKETERSDLGRELHDNVNQLLGASRLYLDMAKRGGVDSNMYLNRSSEFTLSAIEEIRKITFGLTTDTIQNLGLCEAIENIARDTMEVNPVKITYELESFIERSVSDKFKLNIFRIVQEQLNNINKHAKARNVSIKLMQDDSSIILSVLDNGIGFDTRKKSNGIGVRNIKSRAAKYKGNAEFVSKPDEGCLLTVTFSISELLKEKK